MPRWVDGSGLSRYNLISPDDYVWLLEKMKDEFGLQRIKAIMSTGGFTDATKSDTNVSHRLVTKTGSMGGVLSLSGYLTAQSGKLFIFSVLINNFRSSPALLRKKVDELLIEIIKNN